MEPPLVNSEQTFSKEQIKKLLLSESERESLEPTNRERAMIPNSYVINGRSHQIRTKKAMEAFSQKN